MSLSKKSRYVPPHLRENKKDLVIVNPDDEMGPPQPQQQQQQRQHQQQQHVQQSSPQQNQMNHMLNNGHSKAPHSNVMDPHSNAPRRDRSYRNAPSSKPKSHPFLDNNWRKATSTQQPQLLAQVGANTVETEHSNYQTKPRRYESRRVNRGRRGRYNPYQNNQMMNAQYDARAIMDVEDDPNEIQFANMEATQVEQIMYNTIGNPYDEPPFMDDEQIERKKEPRYNRQNVANPRVNTSHEEEMNGDRQSEYELSSNFETLRTENNRQQRRRRNNRNTVKNETSDDNKHTNGNTSGSNKSSPVQQPKKHQKSKAKHTANQVNAVQLSWKSKTAPRNWAKQLKPKGLTQKECTFVAHDEVLDSSQPLHSDSGKVRHVLEVANMTQNDYQKVSTLFRHFHIEFAALLSVNKRWFVVFDHHKTAITALNIVKHNQFKLTRIDTNIADVEMLKNSVPPPGPVSNQYLFD
eukprot:1099290_1